MIMKRNQKRIIDLLLKKSSKSSTWPKPAVEEILPTNSNKKTKNIKHHLKCKSLSFNKNNKSKPEKIEMPEIFEYQQPVSVEKKPAFHTLDALKSNRSIGMDRINKEISDGLLCISKGKLTQEHEDSEIFKFNDDVLVTANNDTAKKSWHDPQYSDTPSIVLLKTVEEELNASTHSNESTFNPDVFYEHPNTFYNSILKQPRKKPILTNIPIRFPKKHKTFRRNSKKWELIDQFRQQLGTNKIYDREPQNFFESLLLNMKNKQKAVKFNQGDMKCLLSRRVM